MKIGITKTLEVFSDLGVLAVNGVEIAMIFKDGIGVGSALGALRKLADLGKAVNELVIDIPGSLPELMDLDAQESAQVGQAAYDLIKKILDAAKA